MCYQKLKKGGKLVFTDLCDKEKYDKSMNYRIKKIGYDKLTNVMTGIFISPYAATSLREYFATGFAEFYTHPNEHGFLQKVSPELYKKLISLQDPEKLDNQ